jgi:hypothetical protein
MNLYHFASERLTDNGMENAEVEAFLLWWGSIGIGRLWAWEDEVMELTARQIEQIDAAAIAWINRGKPQVKAEQ